MATSLEDILQKLLVPDNAVIQQGTNELREAFKNPAIASALCSVLCGAQNPQIRQFAAVLLRRRIVKQWKKVPPDDQQQLRVTLLQVLTQEPEHVVRHSVAEVVSSIAKHDLVENKWPELLTFLTEYTRSPVLAHREVGMLVMSSVSDTAGESLQPHLKGLLSMFGTSTLDDKESKLVPFHTIKTMTALVEYVDTDTVPIFRPLIPKVLLVIRDLIIQDEDHACEAMELFDELVECEVSIVVPHIKILVEFCLEVAANADLGDNIRVKALSFISWLTRLKKKAILKHKLIAPIISVVFPIMSAIPDDEEQDDEYMEEAEVSRPSAFSSQVIDTLALHVPPEKLLQPLMQYVEPALQSDNPYHKKAALMCLAVLAEGCADHIKNKYIEALLQVVCKSIQDSNPVVRNAALFTLGQFSEHLQPHISKYHASILPLLFEYLNQVRAHPATQKDPIGVTKMYYALEMFCENLGAELLLPYLASLMETLLATLESSESIHVQELAISAIGATANAAKELMVPYFPQIIQQLKLYIMNTLPINKMVLQIQAIDTLGVLARQIGVEHFSPLAVECMQLGLKLIEEIDDPDLRRCTYGLFASISIVLKQEMEPYLAVITKLMIESITSDEGVVAHYKEENSAFNMFDEEELSAENGDENIGNDEDIQGYSVENAYLEEKEDACNALGEIATNAGVVFIPYLEQCFNEVHKILDHPASDVRKAAITCVGQFCCSLHKAFTETNTPDQTGALNKLLVDTIPSFIEIINTDADRTVVMATLETINEMLKSMGGVAITGENHLSCLTTSIRNVLQKKTLCQGEEEEIDDIDDDQQAEFDAILLEDAGDLIPSLAAAVGGQTFSPYFAGFLPMILAKTKKTCPVSDKSFAYGILSESIKHMGAAIVPFVPHLYPVLMAGMKDDDDEVRNNAIYGIGVLASSADTQMALVDMISRIQQQSPEEFQKILNSMPQDVAAKITLVLSSS
uniref:Importin-4-like n=1 Tax=Saccoglossus kowalevskii TaxID=10224 RepID=A0ABM0MXK3_SACKO|nr:PREDICTED: importin-4-like [Saccoglossus kowalevskii]